MQEIWSINNEVYKTNSVMKSCFKQPMILTSNYNHRKKDKNKTKKQIKMWGNFLSAV